MNTFFIILCLFLGILWVTVYIWAALNGAYIGNEESEERSSSHEENYDVVYRVQDTSSYNRGASGDYTPSEYHGIKDIDRLKERNPDRNYRLISVDNRTGKIISVLYSR